MAARCRVMAGGERPKAPAMAGRQRAMAGGVRPEAPAMAGRQRAMAGNAGRWRVDGGVKRSLAQSNDNVFRLFKVT